MDLKDLSVHVQKVNVRKERHGEADVLACDVSLRLMMGSEKVTAKLDDDDEATEHEIETGSSWDKFLRELIGENYTEALVEYLCGVCAQIIFAKEHDMHKVVFQYAPDTASLVTLPHSKVNKYKLDCDDIGITFRVQCAHVDGATIGKLAELDQMTIRVSITEEQLNLPLEQPTEPKP